MAMETTMAKDTDNFLFGIGEIDLKPKLKALPFDLVSVTVRGSLNPMILALLVVVSSPNTLGFPFGNRENVGKNEIRSLLCQEYKERVLLAMLITVYDFSLGFMDSSL
ncbi:hypothetical protein U1Q18_037778 [Sarracenia purpurea var. burkii]